MPRGPHESHGFSTTRCPTSRPRAPSPSSVTSATTSWPRMVGKVNRLPSGLSELSSPKSMKTCLASDPQIPVIRVLAITHCRPRRMGLVHVDQLHRRPGQPHEERVGLVRCRPGVGLHPVQQSLHDPHHQSLTSASVRTLSQPERFGEVRPTL